MSREAVPPTAAAGGPRQRLGSWVLPAPEGAYGPVPAWSSAAAWFDAVMDVLRTPEGEEARRAAKVAPDTLLRVAYADRAAADQATGRGVATAHETVAAQLGMSAKTVQRSRSSGASCVVVGAADVAGGFLVGGFEPWACAALVLIRVEDRPQVRIPG